jgi:ATP-binding cassette subfamily A (ABC1) protein 3
MLLAKGQVKEKGSVDYIKSVYGNGYEIVVDSLTNETKGALLKSIADRFRDVTMVSDEFVKTKSVKLNLGNDHVGSLTGFLKYLEANGYLFTIRANTLEDAYIKLEHSTDKDYEAKVERNELDMGELFDVDHKGNYANKLFAVFWRNFSKNWQDAFQIMINLVFGTIAGVLAIFACNNFASSAFEYNGLAWGCVYYILMVGTFYTGFVATTTSEREDKLRYMLRMSGVGSFTYYVGTIAADIIKASFWIFINLLIIFVYFKSEFGTHFNSTSFTDLLAAWGFMTCYVCASISQQYAISWIFSGHKQTMIFMPLVMLLLLTPIALFIQPEWHNTDFYILILAPFVPTCSAAWWWITRVINMFRDQKSTSMNIHQPSNTPLMLLMFALSFVLWLGLAMLFDWMSYRIGKDMSYNQAAEQRDTYVFDQESLDKEKQHVFSPESDGDAITVKDIKKVFHGKFGDFYALKGTSFSLRENEILGILGPNGAGKSTTFNILSAFLKRSDGNIKLKGREFDAITEFFAETGVCFQDDVFWKTMNVEFNLNVFAMIKGVPKWKVAKWMKILNLWDFRKTPAVELSSGMKRKLCIAICMFANPKYKFLDEPSTGLDPITRGQLRELIKRQRNFNNGSTIFTTHTMNEAELLCDRIMILVNGGYSCINSAQELKRKSKGYNVKINFRDATMPNEETLGAALGDLKIDYTVTLREGTQMRLRVDELGQVSDLFGVLGGLKESGGIRNYWCSVMNLEDIFLEISKHQQGGPED